MKATNFLPSALTNEVIGQRESLGVKRQHVGWILGHGKHATEGDSPPATEKLLQHAIVFRPLANILDAGGGALIGPSRQRAAEAGGHYHMRDFVRQNRVEQTAVRALDLHSPAVDLPAVEHECGRSTGAQIFRPP